MKPRLLSCSSSSASSSSPWRMRRKTLHDADQHEQVEDPDQEQERARDGRADQPGRLVQRTSRRRATAPLSPRMPSAKRDREQEHDRRVPEREEEADARAAAGRRSSACASCCRSRRCGRRRRRGACPSVYAVMPTPTPKTPASPRLEVLRRDDREQQDEADDVQADDDRGHAGDRRHSAGVSPPLSRSQRVGACVPAIVASIPALPPRNATLSLLRLLARRWRARARRA